MPPKTNITHGLAIETQDEVTFLHFSGELSDIHAEEVFEKIHMFYKNHPSIKSYVFDFSELDSLNSKSIGHIISFNNMMQKLGGKIVIARPDEDVKKTLDNVGLTRKIEIFQNTSEAKISLQDAMNE